MLFSLTKHIYYDWFLWRIKLKRKHYIYLKKSCQINFLVSKLITRSIVYFPHNYIIIPDTVPGPNARASWTGRKCGYRNTRTWCVRGAKRCGSCGAGKAAASSASSPRCPPPDPPPPPLRPTARIWASPTPPRCLPARRTECRRAAGHTLPTPRTSPHTAYTIGRFRFIKKINCRSILLD